MNPVLFAVLLNLIALAGCTANTQTTDKQAMMSLNEKTDTATLATGCFWCTEAIFEQLKGVLRVTSGYTGGETENPTYEAVSNGETGHAECVQIVYETDKISFQDLLEVFYQVHDPTSLNKQGADEGTQYRSAIFYHDNRQKETAENIQQQLEASGAFPSPIVTEISPFTRFYPAEAYHQEYYRNNKYTNPYCAVVIRPKLEKFQKVFAKKLK